MSNRRYISTRLGRRPDGTFASTGNRRQGLSTQAICEALERLHSDPDANIRITLHCGPLDQEQKIELFERDAKRYSEKALLAIAKGNHTNAGFFATQSAHAARMAANQE
jgi:hypothetical protein